MKNRILNNYIRKRGIRKPQKKRKGIEESKCFFFFYFLITEEQEKPPNWKKEGTEEP